MRIAVSSEAQDLDALVDPMMGGCAYFLLVNPETMRYDIVENEVKGMDEVAEIKAAELLAAKGADVIITGLCGDKAFYILSAANVGIVRNRTGGTVRQAIEEFRAGRLEVAFTPNSSPPWGG